MTHPFDKPRGGTVLVERNGVQSDADEASLVRTLTQREDDNEVAWAVEYRDTEDGPIVHRSAHVHLKQAGVVGALLIGNVGG